MHAGRFHLLLCHQIDHFALHQMLAQVRVLAPPAPLLLLMLIAMNVVQLPKQKLRVRHCLTQSHSNAFQQDIRICVGITEPTISQLRVKIGHLLSTA